MGTVRGINTFTLILGMKGSLLCNYKDQRTQYMHMSEKKRMVEHSLFWST